MTSPSDTYIGAIINSYSVVKWNTNKKYYDQYMYSATQFIDIGN